MSEEEKPSPPSKRPRVEETQTERTPAAQTLFLHCKHIGSRGVLVHELLYAHRESLGMAEWYAAAPCGVVEEEGASAAEAEATTTLPRLCAGAPLEIVHVTRSRKPYFLIEFRYPTMEEDASRQDVQDDAEKATGDAAVMPRVSPEQLKQCTSQLLSLGNSWTWKDQPVQVTAAAAGATVVSERGKIELRDAEEKKARQAELSNKAQQKKSVAAPAPTTTSFVPRAVRRR